LAGANGYHTKQRPRLPVPPGCCTRVEHHSTTAASLYDAPATLPISSSSHHPNGRPRMPSATSRLAAGVAPPVALLKHTLGSWRQTASVNRAIKQHGLAGWRPSPSRFTCTRCFDKLGWRRMASMPATRIHEVLVGSLYFAYRPSWYFLPPTFTRQAFPFFYICPLCLIHSLKYLPCSRYIPFVHLRSLFFFASPSPGLDLYFPACWHVLAPTPSLSHLPILRHVVVSLTFRCCLTL
jgi:hypothetical protein